MSSGGHVSRKLDVKDAYNILIWNVQRKSQLMFIDEEYR
jgi:hypothetical protein